MTATTRLAAVLHRQHLAGRIATLLREGGPLGLIRAAWRLFVRLAHLTGVQAKVERLVEDIRVERMFR